LIRIRSAPHIQNPEHPASTWMAISNDGFYKYFERHTPRWS
jgi:hypothetical protein